MKAILSFCLAVAWILAGIPSRTQAENIVSYDDFHEKLINPEKWSGFEVGIAPLAVFPGFGTDGVRQILGNRLNMSYRGYGSTNSDTGVLSSFMGLIVTNSAEITEMESSVAVLDFEAKGCGSNTEATFAAAGLFGNFFNTVAPIPGSREHDVGASIQVQRSSTSSGGNVLQVVAFFLECNDAACSNRTFLGFADLGIVQKSHQTRLRMQWDPTNNRFIFQRDTAPEVFLPYTVSDAASASNAAKGVNVLHAVPNCTTESRPVGFVNAFFDDVFVNESAVP